MQMVFQVGLHEQSKLQFDRNSKVGTSWHTVMVENNQEVMFGETVKKIVFDKSAKSIRNIIKNALKPRLCSYLF